MLFSTVAVPIYIPTNSAYKGSLFSTSSPMLVIFNSLNDPMRWVLLSPFSEEEIEPQGSNLHMVTQFGKARL